MSVSENFMEDKVSRCPNQQIQMTKAKSCPGITHDRHLQGGFVDGNMKKVSLLVRALSIYHGHRKVTNVCSRYYTLSL